MILLIGFFGGVALVHAVADPPLSLDGSVSKSVANVNSISATLSTSNANDVIVLFCGLDNTANSMSSAYPQDSSSLTWNLRYTNYGSGISGGQYVWEYYAIASNALTSDTTTCHFSGTDNAGIVAFGVSGANTLSPFDSNPGLPGFKQTTATSSSPSVSISTNNAADFIFGLGYLQTAGDTISAPSGFTMITSATTSKPIAADYEITSSAKSGLSVGFSLNRADAYELIADAIAQNGSPVTSTTTITSTTSTSTTSASSTSTSTTLTSVSTSTTTITATITSTVTLTVTSTQSLTTLTESCQVTIVILNGEVVSEQLNGCS